MIPRIYRQGDVLIRPWTGPAPVQDEKLPRADGRLVLAEGEVTGHAHTLPAESKGQKAAQIVGDLLRVLQPCDLTHDEHAPIPLPVGDYEILIQREYHPEEIRNVQD